MSTTPDRVELAFDPYPEQRAVLESDARFRVVAAGRRSGKTLMAAAETTRRALRSDGSWRGYWVGAEHRHADTAFSIIDDAVPESAVARRKMSPPRVIELYNGAEIEFHSAGGGALVSVGLDWAVCDEAGKDFSERTWTQELRPALSDRQGDAMFISTPDGKDWFHDLFQRGQSDDYGDVDSWRWSTYENPHVPDDEVDDARAGIPDRVFRQEYLAEFVDDTGGVFAVEQATADYLPADVSPPGPYRVGVDLARSEDYLAVVVLGGDGRVAHLTRERDLSWPQIQRRVERVADEFGQPPIAIDASRDNKLVSDLERAGLDIHPVKFSAQRKQNLVENLAAGLEAGDVAIPAETMLATELSVFEYKTTRAGNIRYSAPEGHHDDTVDALAMAYDLSEGAGVATARATFGDGHGDSNGETGQTIGDILPDPRQVGGGR